MTKKAIELLDDPSADKGFFLQVEGASIDKQDHAANACGQIGETVDLAREGLQLYLEHRLGEGDRSPQRALGSGHRSCWYRMT